MNNQSMRVISAKERLDREELQVSDMMSQPVFTVSRNETLGDAETLMQRKGIRHIPVVDERGAVVGLISHRDILRYAVSELSEVSALDRNILHTEICIGELMHRDIQTVTPETTLKTASLLMAEKKYGCLPVTEKGKLVGIVTEGDFLRFFADGL